MKYEHQNIKKGVRGECACEAFASEKPEGKKLNTHHFCENGFLDSSFAESIAVSLFGWSEQIQNKFSLLKFQNI